MDRLKIPRWTKDLLYVYGHSKGVQIVKKYTKNGQKIYKELPKKT